MKYITASIVALMTIATGLVTHAESTGLVEPTPAQKAEMDAKLINTGEVRLNQIGLDRINAERAAKGLPPLKMDVVKIGDEVVPAVKSRLEENRLRADAIRKEIEMKKIDLKATVEGKRLEIKEMRGDEGVKRMEVKAFASTTRGEIKDKREEVRGDIKEKRDEIRQNASTTRGEIKAEVKERASKRLTEMQSKITEHLNKAIARLEEIKVKIDSRITKFEGQGVDVTLARADLITASFKIDQAKTAVSAIASVVITTEDPKASLENLKTVAETAKKAVGDAHRALENAVKNFKSSRPSATTTGNIQ